MTEPLRIYLPTAELGQETVVLVGEPLHHLRHVLRAREGTELLLLDGAGLCCRARLETLDRQRALASISSRWQSRETAMPVTLLQSLPKGDKFELILQKGTELGITAFQPLASDRSIPTLSPARLDSREARWQKIIREAARQSRRDILPKLAPLQPFAEALQELPAESLKLALWEEGERALDYVLPSTPPREVVILVGPEGGFAPEEMAFAQATGFHAVHLGPRILRTETAGLAVTPILQYLYGDWRQKPGTAISQPTEEQP